MSTFNSRHLPVLLDEVLAFFDGQELVSFFDGTVGLGGHAAALLDAHPEIARYIAVDQDRRALELATQRLASQRKRVTFVHNRFSEISEIINQQQLGSVDGILLDIGVSSLQIDDPARGFSFWRDGPLDMRMNTDQPLTAALIVNSWSEEELGHLFRDLGEERRWRKVARAIVQARKRQPITTTQELVTILDPVLWDRGRSKRFVSGCARKKHSSTLVFQALRIAVNDELGQLEACLAASLAVLRVGGRLAIISFHSLEDRRVKTFFRELASDKVSTRGIAGVFLDKSPVVKLLTRKPCTTSDAEIAKNPRAGSAKLRVVEKILEIPPQKLFNS